MSQVKVVTPENMGYTIEFGQLETGKFNVQVDTDDLKITDGGELALADGREDHLVRVDTEGSVATFVMESGTEFEVDVADLIPPSKKDAFLSAVTYDGDSHELVLTVTNGEGDVGEETDTEIRVSVADLLPVVTTGVLTGTGTTDDPIKFDTSKLVELTDATGNVKLGHILPENVND